MKIFIISLILVIFLLISLTGAAELSVRKQPVRTAVSEETDLPTDVEWVHVSLDERTFTLFAALNAAGYDDENFGATYHPVRQQVRQYLANRPFSGLNRLRMQLKLMDSYGFVLWAMHYGGPPEFARQEGDWADMPGFMFFGLEGILRDFYQEVDIASLWQEVQPQYELEAARYQQVAGQAALEAIDYTRLGAAPFQKLIVIPNLLDAHWRGYGPQIGDNAYVVAGPTRDEPDLGLIQHETLHPIIGPLVEANLDAIDPQKAKSLYAVIRVRVPSGYGTWEAIVEESVIWALNARLVEPEWRENSLRNAEQAGFLLVRPLAESLESYEQGNATLAEYMPTLLGTINEVDSVELR